MEDRIKELEKTINDCIFVLASPSGLPEKQEKASNESIREYLTDCLLEIRQIKRNLYGFGSVIL
jgi:hypothetical protein